MSAQVHRSDPRILNRRSLARDQRRLAEVVRPGFHVLDIGCGTGAITSGIAKAVGPEGSVVGVDRDESLLAIAREEHGAIGNLRFESGDAALLAFDGRFDFVASSRALLWMPDPGLAIAKMKQAAKSGGAVVVLDYNLAANCWEPEPPPEFRSFYSAFLEWRRANGWDNWMADHLPELFRAAGLAEVESAVQDEVVERGMPELAERAGIWSETIEMVSAHLMAAGLCTDAQLKDAKASYQAFIQAGLLRQTMVMRAVTGVVR
jgi:ubiquinone/menaquinone biosynthesis C-methylase UbiE